MSRRAAREHAFQLIFQYIILQRQAVPAEVSQKLNDLEAMLDLPPLSDEDRDYILAVVPAVVNHSQTLDQAYEPYLKDWKLERLPKVDLAIFRLAVYEIMQRPEVPFSVTLNEAVLLAKRYGSVASSRYINGVLARISKPETSTALAAKLEQPADSSEGEGDLSAKLEQPADSSEGEGDLSAKLEQPADSSEGEGDLSAKLEQPADSSEGEGDPEVELPRASNQQPPAADAVVENELATAACEGSLRADPEAWGGV
ncbi:transcription antitermination factor NusB [Oscillospiraceae bacterium HV4-5-C5C]|nr:transcription antitermination factor NusB [Oscillospiraceae bacterium HV4-5-C5C]